jgi:hypothetical protein
MKSMKKKVKLMKMASAKYFKKTFPKTDSVGQTLMYGTYWGGGVK